MPLNPTAFTDVFQQMRGFLNQEAVAVERKGLVYAVLLYAYLNQQVPAEMRRLAALSPADARAAAAKLPAPFNAGANL